MAREEKTILTNMCMIYDDQGNVLVEDRSKPGDSRFPARIIYNCAYRFMAV